MNKHINKTPKELALAVWGQILMGILFCFVINITFSEYMNSDNYLLLSVMQLAELFIYGGLIYRFFWKIGNGDLNKVNFGKQKRDYFKGLKASMLASIPHFLCYILLIISKVTEFSNAVLVVYKILGTPFVPIIFRFTLSTGMISSVPLWGVIVSGLTILLMPIVATAAYMLGMYDYSIMENLIYKNLKSNDIKKLKR